MKKRSSLATIERGPSFNTRKFHEEMNALRTQGEPVTLKSYLAENYGAETTPEKFYAELGVDLAHMTTDKMLTTTDLNKYLFPEILRDAILIGLEYSPLFKALIVAEENIDSNTVTLPSMDFTDSDPDDVRLRDTAEGANITEGKIITWQDKSVKIYKKTRGLLQTYESIAFTPINLAKVYFQELGTRLGSDLDTDLISVAINGDQLNGSQSAPVIGATAANTLAYADIARAWMRFRRIGRNSTVMLCSEADALKILAMDEFKRTLIPNGITPSGVTINMSRPLPTSQDIMVHDAVPDGKIILVDVAKAFVQITSLPLLIETEKMVAAQLQGEYVSIMTGFANLFRDGRMVLDYTTTIGTNPGPVPVS